ncbi:MAG: hypothetical protein ACK4UJ_04825 [Leptonema sp. (in: bacteria)]
MASENKEINDLLEETDFSLDLDNIELPEIPDLDISEEENLKLEESDENLEESLGEGDLDSEDLGLKQEEGEENTEDGITLNTKELDDILELESIEKEGLDQENIQYVDNIEDLASEKNLEDKIQVKPIEIDLADDLPLKEEEIEIEDNSEQSQEEPLDEESISLSEKELDDILGEEIIESSLSEENEDILKIHDNDLVKQIIPETEGVIEETSKDTSDDEEITLPPLSEVEMEEETISLSPEELDGIISNEEIQVVTDEIQEEEQESLKNQEIEDIELPEPIFEENEAISLTEDELHHIIDDVSQDLTIPEPEIYPIGDQIADREKLSDDLEKETGIKKEELKKIISYLDSLFDKLPEDAIREFSKSEYFNLYKKVIETLEIYPKE